MRGAMPSTFLDGLPLSSTLRTSTHLRVAEPGTRGACVCRGPGVRRDSLGVGSLRRLISGPSAIRARSSEAVKYIGDLTGCQPGDMRVLGVPAFRVYPVPDVSGTREQQDTRPGNTRDLVVLGIRVFWVLGLPESRVQPCPYPAGSLVYPGLLKNFVSCRYEVSSAAMGASPGPSTRCSCLTARCSSQAGPLSERG